MLEKLFSWLITYNLVKHALFPTTSKKKISNQVNLRGKGFFWITVPKPIMTKKTW